MEDSNASAKINELFNTLNEIQGLLNSDTVPRHDPYASKALTNVNHELTKYHGNLKKATEAIQLLDPVMQKYRDAGYNILCEMFDYYERSEWRFRIKYSIIHDKIKFVVSLYVKDASTNTFETVIGTNYKIKGNNGTYSDSGSVTVAKMSIDTFKKSVTKYDKLIHDISELFKQYPLNSLDNARVFMKEFKTIKIKK